MSFAITYHHKVVEEDIPRLSSSTRQRIRIAIEEKLSNQPEVFGKPLRTSLRGYRKLRVGDYRIIFRIEEQTIKILIIAHRSLVYKVVGKR